MKKYLYLFLFLSNIVCAQIGINNPTPFGVCETVSNSNQALFYLPFKNYEIFGALDVNNYTIEYYSDLALTTQISTPYASSNTTIYIKVIDNSNSTIFQVTSMDLIVYVKPDVSLTVTQPTCTSESSVYFSGLPTGNWFLSINSSNSPILLNSTTHTISNVAPGNYTYQIISSTNCYSDLYPVTITAPVGVPTVSLAPELHNYEYPFDGIMTFDLTSQQNNIIGTQTGIDLFYYTSNSDAQNNTNQIANPSAYQNVSNPQTIWVRAVNSSTNCYQITNFKIKVFDSSTIVNIPDLNFKSRLLSATNSNQIAFVQIGGSGSYGQIDINLDGEIQNTEALNVLALNVNSGSQGSQKINDLTGIESFVNISNLDCSSNLLTTLNIVPLLNNYLTNLNCSFNNLSNFNFNSLGSNLNTLDCSGNNISILNISNLTSLYDLSCRNNQLTTLYIAPFHLQKLDCSYNQITSLNFGFPQEMTILDISHNQITNLNLVPFSTNLIRLTCNDNLISNLDFLNINPSHISCGPVSSPIQIENCTNLQYLSMKDMQQGTINFSNLTNLNNVYFWNVDINTIDLSSATNLNYFSVNNSQNLTYINLKCGKTWYGNVGNTYSYPIQISSCPNLNFICSNEINVDKISQVISYYTTNNQNVNINSYCSFSPGGDYNTITGITQFDLDNNGCDSNDFIIQYLSLGVSLNGVSTNSSVFSNSLGNYSLFTNQIGTYELTPNLENPTFFTVSPNPATVNIPVIDNTSTTQNFCITANGVHPDLEIVIAPIVPARPGFDAVYKIVYKNKGNTTLSQQYGINFFYDENVLDFVSTTYATSSVGSGSLSWDYANLKPFENRSFYVTLNVNSPTETPAVNIGDVLTLTASILPSAGDENTFDNLFQFNQTVVGSYDPNDITCIQGEVVAPSYIGQYLHYVINFENTGTYQAENIVVKTQINPADFDIATLRLMEASHNVATRINGNIIEFVFQTINLDTGGHGNILLKIKTQGDLLTSDIVTNKADIYFDYNFPVETNFANTTFQVLSNSVVTIDNSVGVYPNPVNDMVNIKANTAISSIEIYDVQGRIVQKKITNQKTESIDVAAYSNGIYFLKIKTELGEKVEKIVKK